MVSAGLGRCQGGRLWGLGSAGVAHGRIRGRVTERDLHLTAIGHLGTVRPLLGFSACYVTSLPLRHWGEVGRACRVAQGVHAGLWE
jgi:hypothetical protein